MLIQCELIDYVIKKRHTQRAKYARAFRLQHCTRLARRRKTPTVVLDCSLKSISSNYLRHNFNFIVDQSVNFTFSYPPLWLCWWAVVDTAAAVFWPLWWWWLRRERREKRWSIQYRQRTRRFRIFTGDFFLFRFFAWLPPTPPPIAIT